MVVVVKEMYQCLMSEMEKGMATHSSILAWRIPWTEGPDGLWSVGLQNRTWLSN